MSAALTVALLQVEAAGYDQGENLRRGEAACRAAAALGADIALFPEMWNIGYGFVGGELERWRAQAVPRGGAFVQRFAALAAERGMAIGITYLEAWPGAPRNSITLFDRHGRETLTYAKVHTCDFEQPEESLTPGEDFLVATLDTAGGPVEVGDESASIASFPRAPAYSRSTAPRSSWYPMPAPWTTTGRGSFALGPTRTRFCVALANYPASHDDCDGRSVAFHPCVYGSDGAGRDTRVVRARQDEEVCLARFDLDEVREWRRTEMWGGARRRPRSYRRLVDDT